MLSMGMMNLMILRLVSIIFSYNLLKVGIEGFVDIVIQTT